MQNKFLLDIWPIIKKQQPWKQYQTTQQRHQEIVFFQLLETVKEFNGLIIEIMDISQWCIDELI